MWNLLNYKSCRICTHKYINQDTNMEEFILKLSLTVTSNIEEGLEIDKLVNQESFSWAEKALCNWEFNDHYMENKLTSTFLFYNLIPLEKYPQYPCLFCPISSHIHSLAVSLAISVKAGVQDNAHLPHHLIIYQAVKNICKQVSLLCWNNFSRCSEVWCTHTVTTKFVWDKCSLAFIRRKV